MVKKTKGKHRLDKFYHLAKEQGYRSRAAFKLIQLNRKYDFLSGARTMLDLCAAPGGWCQVAVKNMPVGSTIIAVDLVAVKPIRGVKTLIGDITTQQCRAAIRKEAGGALMDVVLCDGAPNVGGAWSSEAYSQTWLVLEALKMATDVLAPRGTFVTKVFRSKDYSALMYALQQLFTKVEASKPAASRNASAEIFVVCQGYKAPAKIDPRLLDAKYIFSEVAEEPKPAGPDALIKQKVKQRRFREGYEDGTSLLRKVLSAAAFVAAENPVELLGQNTSIALEGEDSKGTPIEGIDDLAAAADFVRQHPLTNKEIRILCSDLQVLGRSEFKQLLKWRLGLKKELQRSSIKRKEEEAAAAAADSGSSSDDDQGSDSDGEDTKSRGKASALEEQLLQEMEDIKDGMDRRKKRERRRRRELKVKARLRAAQLVQSEGIAEEASGPESLFSLEGIRTKRGQGVDSVADAVAPSDSDAAASSSDGADDTGSESDVDRDEEQRRYDATMDQYLEESYKSWKMRQRMRDGIVKKKRRRLGMDGEMESDDDHGPKIDPNAFSDSEDGNEEDEEEEEEEEEEERGGGLIVNLDERRAGVPATAAAAANQWFSQDLFEDDNLADDEEEEEEDVEEEEEEEEEPPAKKRQTARGKDPAPAPPAPPAPAGTKKGANKKRNAKEESDDEVAEMNGKKGGAPNNLFSATGDRPGADVVAGFEEVPMSDSDDSDSAAEEYEDLSDDAKAEVRALAKKFLRRKSKDDIMEAAYNRFAFHDTALPKWFADDERKYMRPAPQLTAAEHAQAKEELRAIDARPIKKVAEAKARKQKRLVVKLQKARQKAESVANQEDVPMKSKMREIEKIYKQAKSGKGKKKSAPSRTDQYKKKGPPLDARMRKDKRGLDAAARRNKKQGKGRGGGKAGGGGKRK